jgi:hypothetical protein
LSVSCTRWKTIALLPKTVYIRGYQTAKNVYFDAKKKFTLMQEKVYIFDEKVKTIFIKNMPKNSYEVNQCELR